MSVRRSLAAPLLASALAAAFLPAGEALSADQLRIAAMHAANACQGALPAFETAIRKRPLVVQNEGTAAAFVTCAYQGQAIGKPINASATFHNMSAAEPVAVTCTGVNGSQGGSPAYVVLTTAPIVAGTGQTLTWNADDFVEELTEFPVAEFSISCSLAPGMAIGNLSIASFEDVGA